MTSAAYFVFRTCLRRAKLKKINFTSRPYNVGEDKSGIKLNLAQFKLKIPAGAWQYFYQAEVWVYAWCCVSE